MGRRTTKRHYSQKEPAQALTDDIITGLGSDLVLMNLSYELEQALEPNEVLERYLLPWTREVSKRRRGKDREMWFEALARVRPDGSVKGFSVFLNSAGDLESILQSPWACGTAEISLNPAVLSVANAYYNEIFGAKLRVGQRTSYGLHP